MPRTDSSRRVPARHNRDQPDAESQRRQGSAQGIRDWTIHVNEHYRQTRDTKLVTGVLYAVATRRSRPVRLPCFNDPNNDPRATGLVDDVRVSPWFPNGTVYHCVHNVPGTSLTLANDYTIVLSRRPQCAPPNEAVGTCLGVNLRGNLIVLRHHHRYHMSVTNVHSSERRLIDYVVPDCASYFSSANLVLIVLPSSTPAPPATTENRIYVP
ncbi:hypothetical protein K466DRAFT_604588 [Polyporus arcularius HHB13444]|uniref:Uncharacterized protein n=1 Tax=Polyporus arcularius HHB13444 TaxID=1314778 RepID=A0A5C3NVI9_9APHY|nr:hypothetical protein K466DRAFT_604588 [Polyporus arcularius HHB13444]